MTDEQGGPAALAVEDLTVGFGGTAVLQHVSLSIAARTFTAIVGPNGCGKSTLLRTVAGLLAPLAGHVQIAGEDLGAVKGRDRARRVGFLPQAPLVPTGVTVTELVGYGRHPHRGLFGGPSVSDRDRVAWALGVTRMDDRGDRPVEQLSGGERQRVWLAMALAQETSLLLLDEPTTYLDVRHQLETLALLRALVDDHGLTVVVVLHDLNHAAAFSDRMVILADGGVVADGTPAAVLQPEVIRDAFGVDADVDLDPRTGAPVCRFHVPVAATSHQRTP